MRISLTEKQMKVMMESASELSSVEASRFLKLVMIYQPELENKYKNIIFKESLPIAIRTFAKSMDVKVEQIEKIIKSNKPIVKSGNPLGKTGKKRNTSTSDYLDFDPIFLDDYDANIIEDLKEKAEGADRATLKSFFTEKAFDMINSAALRLMERHNEEVDKVNAGTGSYMDPYLNIPIFDTENANKAKGAYYLDKNSYNGSRQVRSEKIKLVIDNALERGAISGLRWVYNNSKLCA